MSHRHLKSLVDAGDIIGARGGMKRTDKGELSVTAARVQILTKSLMPLPDKWHGLADIEKRYRQRCSPLQALAQQTKSITLMLPCSTHLVCETLAKDLLASLHALQHGQGFLIDSLLQTWSCSPGLVHCCRSSISWPMLHQLHRLLCRYVDLIVNEGVRDTLKSRARMMGALRRILEDRDFLEVRTQTLLYVDWRHLLSLHRLPDGDALAMQLSLCISVILPMEGPWAAVNWSGMACVWWSHPGRLLDVLQVETPVLETSAGGADARPFTTFHNALQQPYALRIATGKHPPCFNQALSCIDSAISARGIMASDVASALRQKLHIICMQLLRLRDVL